MEVSESTKQIADTLARDGSLWFESAFCKGYGGGALLFSEPVEEVKLSSLTELEGFFRTLEEKLAKGYFLAGWMSYEVGYGFEPALFSIDGAENSPSPLAWFGVYSQPEHVSERVVEELFSEHLSVAPGAVSFNLSKDEYGEKIRAIRNEIAAGNVYQVNFTGRNRFKWRGTPSALFGVLRAAQPLSYTAFLKSGDRTILSFSPELFFRKRGMVIETMPMKGTAPRGSSVEEDCRLREGLIPFLKQKCYNIP